MIIHLLILQVVTFLVLLLVLRQLFYKQLNAAMQRLQALHKLNLSREQELKLQAEAAEAERKEKLEKAQDEADRIIREACTAAEKVTADVEAQAHERAARIVEKVQADLDRKSRDLLAEQHQQAVELAVRMVKLAFSSDGQEALQDHLMAELIGETAKLDGNMFAELPKGRVQVVSAYPMSPSRSEELVRVLSEKTGSAVEIDLKQDPGMVAGLVISVGSLTLDGSLRNKLEKAALILKK